MPKEMRYSWLAILLLTIAILAVQIFIPAVQVNGTTVQLVGIAALLAALPAVAPHLRRVRKMKVAGLELEIAQFTADVKAVSESISPHAEIPPEVLDQIAEILRGAAIQPQGVLLELCSALERHARARLGETTERLSLQAAIRSARNRGDLPVGVEPALDRFYKLKGRMAEERLFKVDNRDVLAVIAAGVELLKFLAAKDPQDVRRNSKAS